MLIKEDMPYSVGGSSRRSRRLFAIDAPPPCDILPRHMDDIVYSDDKFVEYKKRRQRERRNSAIGLIILALAVLVAMLLFWR